MFTGRDPDGTIDTIGTLDRSLWRAATVRVDRDQDSVSIDAESAESAVAVQGHRYHLHEVLGSGGMGEVHLCRDEIIGREVALKTLLDSAASEQAERRFLREARVQGQLEHPSIVPVYDLGESPDGRLYFTMRRVRGHTLAEVLGDIARRDAFMIASYSRRKLLAAFVRVCLAVHYAHTRGVLHRDLKPSNIMLGDFGEVYVLDWGIARLVTDHATTAPVVVPRAELAAKGAIGTPGYMSPEQLLGLEKSEDARTDVYSLGAILYEILTLRRLHQGRTFEELAESTRLLERASPAAVDPDIPPELDAICARAASTDRSRRFASARDLCDAIERYLDGDRDTERRRELAAQHATAAAVAFARVSSPSEAEADKGAAVGRIDAVREVTASLMLDPENAEARRLLMRLFVEVPARMPPEVETEIEATTEKNLARFLRYGTYGVASWPFLFPIVVAMGVRSWPPVLATTALALLSVFCGFWLRRKGSPTVLQLLGLSALVFTTVASVSCFMGPFVIVPAQIAITTMWLALLSRTRRERGAVLAMGVLGVTIPFVVELLGIVPPAYAFAGGNVTLFARAVELGPRSTIALLIYTSVATVFLPALLLGRVREFLQRAERRLFLQAWHLRQLLPESRAAFVSRAPQ